VTTLYKKEGRKYVPYAERLGDYELTIPVGSFVLSYAYANGGKRYSYNVKPDTAGFEAAAMIAQNSICEAIHEKSKYDCDKKSIPYTKKQLAIIKEFREKMIEAGGLMPMWWTSKASYEIAEAAIDAVRNYKL
jgi:hypothetical protein